MNSKFVISAKKRCIQVAVALAVGSTLAACGGGGSGNEVVDKPGTALFTSAGPKITVAVDATAEFSVGGGGGESKFTSYTATSADPKIAKVSLVGTKLAITGLASGTTTVNVADTAGANVTIEVTVPGLTAGPTNLTISAPASVNLSPGVTVQYKVAGGAGPYTAVSSSPAVAAVSSGQGAISVTAANPGSATIVVYDAAGNSAKLDLAVDAGAAGTKVPLYTTAPESLRLQVGSNIKYVIRGGVAPYTATSSTTSVLTSAVDGEVLTINAVASGTALVRLRDSVGDSVAVNAVVDGAQQVELFTTAPSSISIGVGPAPAYSIQGGVAPYTASTSNAGVARATVTDGNALTITGIGTGMANIVVFDSTGKSVPVAVSVSGGTGNVALYTTAPDSITIAVGAAPTYTIGGGAGPYVVTSSNVAVVSVSQSGNTFTASGLQSGLATIAIRDANGTPVNISVTVP